MTVRNSIFFIDVWYIFSDAKIHIYFGYAANNFVFSLSITPQEPQEKRTPSTKKGNSLPQKTEALIKKIFTKGTFYSFDSIFSLREIHTANGIDIKKVHTSATACAISTP